MKPILPGATLGVLGSGQLGRMFALAARRMGYRVNTFSPDTDTPTGQVADKEVVASYDDLDAVRAFARETDVVTFEFENVPAATVSAVANSVPVRPSGHALHISQNRLREKSWLEQHGFPCTKFRHVTTLTELQGALAEIGVPAILKTAGFGYDGKGQVRIHDPQEAGAAWQELDGQECVLEAQVAFTREVSVVAARAADGAFVHYGIAQNHHVDGILDLSVSGGCSADDPSEKRASAIAQAILHDLEVVGVLCVEFFQTQSGELLVNELAPRPHNSGHLTIDACVTSQFEQQVRAVCGLPLGSTERLRPAAMANLLGDLWQSGEPNWPAALALSNVHLHFYGKEEARPGRKMGHLTALAPTADEAEKLVRRAREVVTLGTE